MNSSQFLAQLRLCVFEMQAGMAQTWLCTIFSLCTHEIETNIHVLACHPTMGARFEPLAGAANGHVPLMHVRLIRAIRALCQESA